MTWMMHRVKVITLVLWLPTCLGGQTADGQASDDLWERDRLSGEWLGLRSNLADRGLQIEAYYTGEVMRNLAGGLDEAAEYLDNIELKVLIDLQTLVNWPDARMLVYGLGNHGGFLSRHVGDAQGVSNIEAVNAWKLYEIWLQQNVLSNRVSLLFGLYDLNSEFDFMQTAALFINSSHGIGAEYAASGPMGPSIFPHTALGLRIKFLPKPTFYVQTAVFDGIPGDPDDLTGTHVIFGRDDGLLLAAEVGYVKPQTADAPVAPTLTQTTARRRHVGREVPTNYRTKVAVGVWGYTSNFQDTEYSGFSADPLWQGRRDWGAYVLWDALIYAPTETQDRGLALFARLGIANGQVNRFRAYTGAGVVLRGLLPGRPADELGVGLAAAHTSAYYRQAKPGAVESAEVALELTYRGQVLPWLALQPDLQYVINPNADPTVANAWVVGLRSEVTL